MIPLISARRVEEFANAVDGISPARRADVRALGDLVETVREVECPAPGTDFVADLRIRLLAAAAVEIRPGTTGSLPARRPERRIPSVAAPLSRRFAVAATVLVAAGGGVGLVATSTSALPGDTLYPVKRATERADLLLHTDAGDDARILLAHAETRLGEVAGLLSGGGSTPDTEHLVAATLGDFTDEATQGGQILLGSYEQTGSRADIEDLRGFTDTAATTLQELGASLPPSTTQAYTDAADALGALDAEAVVACPTCHSGTPAVDLATDAVATARQQLAPLLPGTPPHRHRFFGEPRRNRHVGPFGRIDSDAGTEIHRLGGGGGGSGGSTHLDNGSPPATDLPDVDTGPATDLPEVGTGPAGEPDADTHADDSASGDEGTQPPSVAAGDDPSEVVDDVLPDVNVSDDPTAGGSDGPPGSGSTNPVDPGEVVETPPLPLPLPTVSLGN